EIPDVESLSNKSVSQLEEIVGSLGLNWRVKLMIDSAKEIVDRFGGKIPCDLEKLKELPGVSDYIASAIMIFSCGCLLPLLDTNTVRITARYFGLEQSDSSRRMKDFRDGVLRLIDHRKIIDSYYALIDLGALICKPINPRCSVCPMREGCRYHKETAK
ncbi:MAG: DNA-binding protein, partial [Candidatus Parvarchaeota archaeon]